ncbi:MAG: hypothetical protein NC311_11690 [Muribaculaceae bacterium]|nr:hypothetical protein [Muribaculaceae bacterium]
MRKQQNKTYQERSVPQQECSVSLKSKTMARKSNTGIPGLSFSWKRALGITQTKQKFARETDIPTSKAGLERNLGNMILKTLFGKK